MNEFVVLLFGPEARLVGADQVRVQADAPRLTCGALREHLQTQAPQLGSVLASCRFAVNHNFATDATQVGVADEVALIGAVSGG